MLTTNEPIALLTDIHANLEALEAIIKDIKRKNIKYIFSLGDIVGLGPNPKECVDILMENNIINILGNNDYYTFLPLDSYRHFKDNHKNDSYKNAIWTKMQLSKEQIDYLRSMPPSVDIKINDNLIALCHFPCDVRYYSHATWEYSGCNTDIFYKTNTDLDLIHFSDKENPCVKSAIKRPIFEGKTVDTYDDVIFGHYHFQRTHHKDENHNTEFHSLNSSGVAIGNKTIYYILYPTEKGYKIEKSRVPYNRRKLLYKLDNIDYPNIDTFNEYVKKK